MADEFDKQMKAEEKLYSEKLSKVLTDAVNTKQVIAESDELNGTSSKWPHEPSKDLYKILTKAMMAEWSKQKKSYAQFKEDLTLEHKKGKRPEVTAVLTYDGEYKGGKSVMLKKGDSLLDVSKDHYGLSCYAGVIADYNKDVLGSQCKVLPAGFGLELPRLWVPNWIKEPKVPLPPVTKAKAEEIRLPSLDMSFSMKSKTVTEIPVGDLIIEVTFTVSGDVKITNKGILSVGMSPEEINAGVEKMLGPFGGGFEMDLVTSKASAGAKIKLFSTEVKGLTFSGAFKMASGGIGVELGVATVKEVKGDLALAGSFKAKATVKIYPNPRPVEESAYEASIAAHLAVAVIIAIPVVTVAAEGVAAIEIGAAGRAILQGAMKLMEASARGLAGAH